MKILSVMMAVATISTLTACSTMSPATNQTTSVPNRTLSDRVVDESIEHSITRQLAGMAGFNDINGRTARVVADSFHGEVLLTGEVPSDDIKSNIEQMVSATKNVKKVYNYLTVSHSAKSPSHTTHENYLKSKIRAKMLGYQAGISPQYKIVLRSDVVYLMGYVNADQQSGVVQAVDSTMGIQKLILLNTLVDDRIAQGSDDVLEVSAVHKAPIVRMEDTPVSDYVRLHNNTTNP